MKIKYGRCDTRILAIEAAKRAREENRMHDIETRAADLTTLYNSTRTARGDLRQRCRDVVKREMTGNAADITEAKEAIKLAEDILLRQEKLLRLAETEARELYPSYFSWL